MANEWQVESVYAEALAAGDASVRTEGLYAEVLARQAAPDAQIGLVYLEVLTPSGSAASAVTGNLVATSPAHVASLGGAVEPPPVAVTGTLAATTPAHTANLAGRQTVVGTLGAIGPAHTADLAGAVAQPVSGTLDALLPVHTADLSGRVAVEGQLDAVGPAHRAAFSMPGAVGLAAVAPAHVAALTGVVPIAGTLGNPYQVSDAGSQALDFTQALDTPTDPPAVDGDNASLDLWLTFVATAAADLSATFDAFPVGLELWTGADFAGPDTISLVGSGTPTDVSAPISEGVRYYLRVHPIDAAETGSGTLTWTSTPRSDAGDLTLDVTPQIYETPGWLSCSVSNATVVGDLQFTCSASMDVLLEIAADDAGQAVGIAVPLPALPVGDYTLTVVDVTSGETATASFSVLTAPAVPTTPDPSALPTPPAVVTRWQIEDPAGESYSFPINPSRMSSPHSLRALSVESVTSPAGQPLTFEGEAAPSEWQVEGSVLTEDFFGALERFYALSRRLYVVDHLSRAWVVTFESLEWTQVRSSEHPWAHTYKAKFLIYDGPLSIG